MSFLEGLVWVAIGWGVFFGYAATDVPGQLTRLAGHLRRQHLPHWARHGHAPSDQPLSRGRHRA